MDDVRDKIRVTEAAARIARPGRTPAQIRALWHRWMDAGIIPPAVDTEWGAGGLAFVFPESAAAIAAVLFDLFDAGAVRDREHLRSMWSFFADPHHEGGEPMITHVLAEAALQKPCFLVITFWRHQTTGELATTNGVRFHEALDEPFDAPSQFYVPVSKCVTPLHLLLARFVDAPTQEH